MSPLRWMQSTAPHWTIMLEDVTSDTLTEVGAADGAGGIETLHSLQMDMNLSPASRVIAGTASLAALLPAILVAVTMMV